MALTPDEQKVANKAIEFANKNKKQIAKELIEAGSYESEDNPVSVFMAGSPGAGKTETSKALIDTFDGGIIRIDADDLRDRFEDYNGNNSYLFQASASILVEKIHDLVLKKNQSFILDGTLTNYNKAVTNIDRSIKRGRPVYILYVYQNPELAWEFVQAREIVEGRRVLKSTFLDQYFLARDVVNNLKAHYKDKIQVELLIKDSTNSTREYKANIDVIDNHIPESYTRAQLEERLDIS